MKQSDSFKIIAVIHSDFTTKFGIPRQSGLISELKSMIVFEPEFRDASALRGLEGYSHLWLLWKFSENERNGWSPTVRPPRLGGNKRVGVFATRSPFRPNPIGLSSVRLEEIKKTPQYGTVLIVSGADLMDGTPIYDIKPYIAYTDCHSDAVGGFSDGVFENRLKVNIPQEICERFPKDKLTSLKQMLSADPRPAYQDDNGRIYSFDFAGYKIKFRVSEDVLSVVSIE